jgi:acyl-coenzyme A synthetase/AMP-(fatty) acid ligase
MTYNPKDRLGFWKVLKPILSETLVGKAGFEIIEATANSVSETDGRNPGTAVVLTSGTTGQPKRIDVNIHERFSNLEPSKDRYSWFSHYSLNRWAFLDLASRAILGDQEVSVSASGSVSEASTVFSQSEVNAIACTPSFFQLLSTQEAQINFNAIELISFGGQQASERVLSLAARLAPRARITQTYASTETGLVAWHSDGKHGFPPSAFRAETTRFDSEGELIYRGFPTGDLWEVRGDRFFFVGRKDNVVDIFGQKVNLDHLASQYEFIAGITVVELKAKNTPFGNVLQLDFVGTSTEDLVRKKLDQLPQKHLRPVRIRQVTKFELDENGKKLKRLEVI